MIEDAVNYMPYLKGMTIYRAGSKGNEPLQAIALTKENVEKYMGQQGNTVGAADGAACTLGGDGECG
jgi:hypothetical protein